MTDDDGLLAWLGVVPAPARRGLIALTLTALAIPTALLPWLPGTRGAQDVAVIALVVALAAVWAGVFVRFGRPELERRAAERAERERRWHHDRGVLAGAVGIDPRGGLGALVRGDVGFSLPEFLTLAAHAVARDRDDPLVGPCRVTGVARRGDRLEVDVHVPVLDRREGTWSGGWHLVRMGRPAQATSPPPSSLGAPGPDAWTATVHPTEGPPPGRVFVDPDVAAERRALLARDALGPDGFEALITEIDAALDGDVGIDGWCTGPGLACVRWWSEGQGLPPGGEPTIWLDVEEDGWTERVDVARGERVLGLMRPSGQPETPWRLWWVGRRAR